LQAILRPADVLQIIAFNTLLEKNGYLTMVQMQMQNQNDSAFNATGQAAQLREALTLKGVSVL